MMKKIILLISTVFLLSSCFGYDEPTSLGNSHSSQQNSMQESIQIFALGDSLTVGYGLPVEDSYPSLLQELLDNDFGNYRVVNAGVSGNTSAELKSRLDWVLSDARSGDIAILVIGGNDGLRGMNLSDLESNLVSIINDIQDREMQVVMGGMQIPPNLGLQYTRDFRKVYEKVAEEFDDIYFIDFFLDGVAADPAYNLSDMIHPNRAGYEIIAKHVYDFLTTNDLIGSK